MSQSPDNSSRGVSLAPIRWMTYGMFALFAMTTDAVGVIIPEVVREFQLSQAAGSAFHYATMAALAIAGMFLGSLADRLGHKRAILLGLALYAAASALFAVGNTFGFFVTLLVFSGFGIGVFRSGALALIADISRSTREHTATMNTVEGFFAVGAIAGPAIVTTLLHNGVSWKWLYLIAAGACCVLITIALGVRYPTSEHRAQQADPGLGAALRLLRDPTALVFATGLFLYVAVECAIYVWMPTLIAGYDGSFAAIAPYALSIFFALRAVGRFLGSWMLDRFDWTLVLLVFGCAILLCFAGSVFLGIDAAVLLLPLSGLFMSVVYPTLNSKGISCQPKERHGAAAGLNLFFSCLAAVLGPFAMGLMSDAFGGARPGFLLATGFALLLAIGTVVNFVLQPARERLAQRDVQDYAA